MTLKALSTKIKKKLIQNITYFSLAFATKIYGVRKEINIGNL